jgi:adenylate kinase family enzyme
MAQRIAIIGTSGAGKTTLGRALARRIGGVFIEVDALAHKANWVNATDEELRAGMDAAMADTDRWVIDGTFQRRLGDFVTARADLIVWLDLPLTTILLRLWRRSWRRVRTREVLWNGNIETWRDVCIGRDSVLIGAMRRHFRNRHAWPRNPDRARILRLRTPAEVENWLATFSSEAIGPAKTQRGSASPTPDTRGAG